MRKITRLKKVNIVVIEEESSKKSIPQFSGSWDEAVRIELTSYQNYTKRIRVALYNVGGMAALSCGG